MTFEEYQRAAVRTANPGLEPEEAVANWALGLAGETGELVDALKKWLYHGHELAPEAVLEELGDVLWYLAVLADELGLSLGRAAEANVGKLARRYVQGFSREASQRREV